MKKASFAAVILGSFMAASGIALAQQANAQPKVKTIDSRYNGWLVVRVEYQDAAGKPHNDNGPSAIEIDAETLNVTVKEYKQHGQFDRIGGPAFLGYDRKTGELMQEQYLRNDKLDRDDGPAIIKYKCEIQLTCLQATSGTEEQFWKDGKLLKVTPKP